MKISRRHINEIIQKQLQLISEDRETFTSKNSSENAKIILIASEYFKKIFAMVLKKIKEESHQTKKNNHIKYIEDLLVSSGYADLMSSIENIKTTNAKILLAKQRLDAGNRLLSNYIKDIKNLFGQKIIGSHERVNKVSTLTQEFTKHSINFEKFIDETVANVRNLFNYKPTNEVDLSNNFIPKDIINTFSEVERVGFEYLSQIELLFQKFASIKVDIVEYNKKWEDYAPLKAQTLARQAVTQGKDQREKASISGARSPRYGRVFSQPEIDPANRLAAVDMSHYDGYDKYSNMFTGHMSSEFNQPLPLQFSLKKFLSALYGAREKEQVTNAAAGVDKFMKYAFNLQEPNVRESRFLRFQIQESLEVGEVVNDGLLKFKWDGKDFINSSGIVADRIIQNKLKTKYGLLPAKTATSNTNSKEKKKTTSPVAVKIKSPEEKKADVISKIIWKLDEYNSQTIKDVFKIANEKLWDPKSQTYLYDKYIKQMFYDLYSARRECRKVLNTLLRLMDEAVSADVSALSFFEKNEHLIKLFIKRVQFFKVSLKNSFLKLMTSDKAEIDTVNEPNKLSAETDEKVKKRLEYWNLFRKMGWVDKEAPDFLYQ